MLSDNSIIVTKQARRLAGRKAGRKHANNTPYSILNTEKSEKDTAESASYRPGGAPRSCVRPIRSSQPPSLDFIDVNSVFFLSAGSHLHLYICTCSPGCAETLVVVLDSSPPVCLHSLPSASSLGFSVAHPCGGSSPAVPSYPRQNSQQPTAASSTHSQPASNKPRLRRFVLLPVSRFFFFSRFCLARDSCCLFPAADLLVTTQF